ncbi:MAG: starch-binding protein [Prevotella sp.]|nr:starch-binding protein [Prevotella sp.]
MKRFFTFLMAILALLSISQAAKAAEVTVYFQKPGGWSTPVCAYVYDDAGNHPTKWQEADECSRFYTSTGVELWSYTFSDQFTNVIFKNGTNQYPANDGTKMKVVNNYVYVYDTTNPTNPTGTPLSEFVKNSAFTYTLRGGYEGGGWSDESANFEFVGDGKYTYTFTAAQTGEFRFRVNTNYTSGQALCPNVDANTKRKELTSTPEDVKYADPNDNSAASIKDNYWFYSVTAGKKYTFTLSEQYLQATDGGYYHSRKLSVVPEEAVVTKEIKLFNGSSELTGSNGKYTLDLSSATADAAITLSIDDETYGLATAQTIAAAGTTSGIAFTAGGTEALTLKAGLVYSLTVTEDGKMTVVAKEKGVADGNYYLVGNFFEEDGKAINYDKKYFRFINSKGDGTLTFDIPASLEIKAQVYASNGTCYGPVNGGTGYGISNTHPTAAGKSVNGNLVAGTNYWTFSPRGLEETGIYTITINVDAAGTPTKWEVKYDNSKRMAYFLVDPTEDYDAVVHPAYAVVKEDRSCNNNFYGNIYLEAGQHCFVVGNLISGYNDDVTGHPVKTTKKLYLQGNGGLDPTTDISGSERDNYTKVCPNRTKGFTYNITKTMVLEYNPARGNNTIASQSGNYGICGEILDANKQITDKQNPITFVQIVGNGVVGSWKLSAAENMHYNKTLDCWEYTFKTKKPESDDNKFRFIANGSWKYNWGEDSTEPSKQARTPYTDTTKPGLEASLKEPNELGFTTNGTERGGDGTYGDMIFNRPAGEWTIRLYIRTLETEEGNNYVARYAYTITGREHTGIPLTYRAGKFIRTYSNNVAMDIIDPNVKVYEAYKYTMPDQVDNIYSQGTLELRQLKYIPANMGVVLIGTVPDTEGKYKDGDKLNFSISKRTEKSAEKDEEYVDVWTKAADYKEKDEKWNNFLVPTVEAVPNLGNAEFDDAGNVTYRYFGLANFFRTLYYKEHGGDKDYIGFFRYTAKGASDANKAYLSLPTREDLKGGKYGYINYNGQLIGTKDEDNESLAKMMIVFDDEMGAVTEIKHVEATKSTDNAYYTLQGVKVLRPAKGIYIHNGKKIVFK